MSQLVVSVLVVHDVGVPVELGVEELRELLAQRDRQVDRRDEQIAALTAAVTALSETNAELVARVARLEHLLTRNSGNSSMPPSRDDDPGHKPPAEKQKKPNPAVQQRKRGKQPGSPGTNLAWTQDPNATENLFPQGTCDCGADLAGGQDLGIVDRYQRHDIPEVTVRVTQFDCHEVACGCGRTHAASRPDGARSGPVGYGPNLQALAVYLLVVHHLPVQRCVALLAALTGAAPSAGFVHAMLARTAATLGAVQARIRALIVVSHVVCCDETPIRVGPAAPKAGKKKADKYLLVAATDLYTHYLLGGRDLETFKAFVLKDLAAAGAIVVHDRYVNYDSDHLGALIHQLCCAHLLRDLTGAAEVYPDAEWPTQVADSLRGLIHHANLARAENLSAIEKGAAQELITRLRDGVKVGLSETVRHGDRPGERKARLLLQCLRDREADVLRFTTDLRVPPTSNQAERDLRPAKIQQNISGRLTSEDRTEDRWRIRGYVSTAIKHGHAALDVLRDALTGRPWIPPDPVPV
ncbi:IS66 family transposase [Nocardia sp. CA-128927]|uniref:IS66 family transposase n=1 Tax=Nocardia sp. CA-128927 TaxID=3239975 RepID=UPI003D95BBF3